MAQSELTRRNFLGTGASVVAAGAPLGTILRAGAARAAATANQTLTVDVYKRQE